MKRCPNCQKEFPDSMRFCQTDGTPLVEVAEKTPPPPPPDPYKTVVGGSIKMDPDLLEIPEQDPMKTMVSPISMPKPEVPKPPANDPFSSAPPKPESKPIAPPSQPKPSEPSLSPPNFGDSSSSPSRNVSSELPKDPPKFDSPSAPKSDPFNAPPPSPFGSSPFSNEPNKGGSPFDNPSSGSGSGSSPFDKPSSASSSSPFDKAPSPPPFKEPEQPKFSGGQQQSPFGSSPFDQPQPQTPFGQQNDPFNKPVQQNDWAPPPAPVASWQDQGLGANTPFQPPVAGAGGQNKTLAIISLVTGVLSIFCCGWFIPGIVAIVLGFMAKNKADQNPAEFGGRGLALGGMITGAISIILGIIVVILYVFTGALSQIGRF